MIKTRVTQQDLAGSGPSLLLPGGATLSVFAALLEGTGGGQAATLALALAGTAAALAGWFMYVRVAPGVSAQLGVRFFSVVAMAFAISSLLYNAGGGWIGWMGVIGLWLAATGAGIEWVQGRTYGLEPGG